MKATHRMVCEVERVHYSQLGVERGIQEAVQRRLDDGWTLRAATGGSTVALLIFVKKMPVRKP